MRVVAGIAARRLLQLIPVVVGVSFLTFAILNLIPGSAALADTGAFGTASQIRAISEKLGLDKPYFTRYGLWVWHAIHGNLGTSYVSGQSVVDMLRSRIPVSLELLLLSVLGALIVSVPVAILSARRPLGSFDWFARTAGMLSLSIPGFVFCLLFLLVFAVALKWLPTSGFTPLSGGILSNLRTMALPVLVQISILFGSYSRILRADMVDQLTYEDYVLIARSKGISQRRVLVNHVFRNSVFSLITIVGTQIGILIAGGAIAETIFSLPGLGQLLINAINSKDIPVVQALVVLIALVVVIMNLLTDLLYMALDPRVRYGTRNR